MRGEGMRVVVAVVRVIVMLMLIGGAFGWGKDGHYAVCKIAQVHIFYIFCLNLVLFD